MAKYRSIHEKIWKDPDFEVYSSEGKLAFIYLCTNSSTSESGIYAITPNTISNETSIKPESVIKILKSLKNVIWDEKHNYIYVRRFRLYNGGGAPDNIKKAIVAEFLQSSTLPLWVMFVEDYPEFKESILATGKTLTPSLFPPTPPVTNSNSNSNSNSIEPLDKGSATVGQPLLTEADLPDYVNKELWKDFLEMRKKIKKVPTKKAVHLLIKVLIKFKEDGQDTDKILEQSIINNYQGLFALKEEKGGNTHGPIGKLAKNAFFKPQPPSPEPHYIDGDAEVPEKKD